MRVVCSYSFRINVEYAHRICLLFSSRLAAAAVPSGTAALPGPSLLLTFCAAMRGSSVDSVLPFSTQHDELTLRACTPAWPATCLYTPTLPRLCVPESMPRSLRRNKARPGQRISD